MYPIIIKWTRYYCLVLWRLVILCSHFTGLPPDFLKTVNTKLRGLVLNIKEYLLTEKVFRRTYILSVSEDFFVL